MSDRPYSPLAIYGVELSSEGVAQELEAAADAIAAALPSVVTFLYAAPKPREGLIAAADGTNWNPGAGKGLYIYYGGAWNKLG